MRCTSERVAEVYLSSSSVVEAAQRLHVSRATLYRWLAREDVQQAIHEIQRQLRESIHHELILLARRAIQVLHDCLESDDERVRLNAAKLVLVRLDEKAPQENPIIIRV